MLAKVIRLSGQRLVEELRQALSARGNNASGTLSASIEDTGGDKEINIVALRYGQSLQFGRQPTVNDGNGELLERIQAWIQAKGLSLNAYAVTKKIHKCGTKRYREIKDGQNPNTDAWISDVVSNEAVITQIQKDITDAEFFEVQIAITNILKK